MRCHVRRIGFHHDGLKGQRGHQTPQLPGALKGHSTAKAELESHLQTGAGLLFTAIERMRNPFPGLAACRTTQILEHLVDGAAHMQQHWQVMFARQRQLGLEKMLLPGGIEAGNKIVQPDFTHCDQTRVVSVSAQGVIQTGQISLPGRAGTQRMDAQRIGILLPMRQQAHDFKVVHRHSRDHAQRHVDPCCPLAQTRHFVAKLCGIEVTVCIDKNRHVRMMPEALHGRENRATVNYLTLFCQRCPMPRPAFYSRSASQKSSGSAQADDADDAARAMAAAGPARSSVDAPPARWRPGPRSFGALLVVALAAAGGGAALWPKSAYILTQKDIDAAVLRTLQTASLPSQAMRAAEIIRPSVVRVVAYGPERPTPEARLERRGRELAHGKKPAGAQHNVPSVAIERGVGTGVVIVDSGVILTNLHVVAGATSIKVTFFDGLESIATIKSLQPENDLAVLQAQKIPDDLVAATMRSTADLQSGDEVVAVGFPFGIGPSVSAGVVSGLKRSFRSPEGRQPMTNLIQFDAAANPGNSGGPLVNTQGEVLGIVTAILNPTQQRTFIGIAFAVPIEEAASAAGMPPF